MPTHFSAIYLSPHLDDVTLSCGAQIYDLTRAGENVLIVSVMAGDPPQAVSDYAQSLHDRWELLVDASAARRAEDLDACRILGAEALHWSIPDCIYRSNPATGDPLYLSDADIFSDVHPAEEPLIEQIAAFLVALPTAERIFAPLTIGHHVDHLLVRAAAERIYLPNLFYYEDYPYAQESAKRDRTLSIEPRPLSPSIIPVSAEARRAKIAAILAYRSQLSTFWTDNADLEQQVFGYLDAVGGERVWRLINARE
ncbi:MAG: PIG-L family deacetylase [Caldilineaceae bacterium]|nr:PIG-L family deacetylase [Caldilineaceae bacterium]